MEYILFSFRNFLSSIFELRCDLAKITLEYGSWYYLNSKPEIVNVGFGEYKIYVTMRGTHGVYYDDPDYWHRVCVTKLGKKKFRISQASHIVSYIMKKYEDSHADHG